MKMSSSIYTWHVRRFRFTHRPVGTRIWETKRKRPDFREMAIGRLVCQLKKLRYTNAFPKSMRCWYTLNASKRPFYDNNNCCIRGGARSYRPSLPVARCTRYRIGPVKRLLFDDAVAIINNNSNDLENAENSHASCTCGPGERGKQKWNTRLVSERSGKTGRFISRDSGRAI